MKVTNWIAKQPSRYRNEGIRSATHKNKREIIHHLLRQLDTLDSRGVPIYEDQWEVLIILDACRVDLLESVSPDYSFLPETISSKRSVASCSRLWMDRNFTETYREVMAQTAHVTGNPFSEDHLNQSWFKYLDEVWKYAWDEEVGTVRPRSITDRAIATARNQEFDRLIIHYLQPHFPSIPEPLNSGIDIETFGEGWDSIWDQLRTGETKAETVWNSYEANLRHVLDDVDLLLNNLSSEEVIITADHGNAFGEWDLYGHPPKMPVKALREVPWISTSATDTKEYDPSINPLDQETTQSEIEDRLADLGYL